MIDVAAGRPVWALGLMSGTSLDGIDAAMLLTDGEEVAEFGPSVEHPYSRDEIAALARVHADWARYDAASTQADREILANAEHEVVSLHAAAVAQFLVGAALDGTAMPAVLGFHGQTVAHVPAEGWTWQLGDGDVLARVLNRPVVWDFRTDDMRAGGQGAPLAPFYHFALARRTYAEAPLAFLNIGGVANVTWVDPGKPAPEADGALVAFDTGPGNALIDDWMAARTGEAMDREGAAAAAGRVRRDLLASNSGRAYLERSGPKSLDRNDFSAVLSAMDALSVEDGAATLTALTVDCIAESVRHMPSPPARWLVCGGGRRNGTMMQMLAERLGDDFGSVVEPVEEAGFDGDMLEAQAFAYLAVRVLRGLPTSAPGTTGCRAPVCGGSVAKAG